jgi:hypothetical protein
MFLEKVFSWNAFVKAQGFDEKVSSASKSATLLLLIWPYCQKGNMPGRVL